MMRFGSVCSGIEAASQAWPFWQAAWFSEIEPFPCAVLKHHYPEVPNHGDMTTLPDRILSGEVEAPDVFCGGTPCQAFSVAGNRKSLDDARGNLSLTFCEIADAIDAVRYVRGSEPAVIFWENVPGVLNTTDNAFGCFLGKLAGEHCELQPPGGRWTDAGVVHGPKRTIAWRVLDAQYFGLAQRRRRVFVVASSRKGFNPSEVLFEFDGLRRDTAPSRQAGQGIAADAESGIVTGGGIPEIAGTILARDFKGVNTFDMEEGKYAVCSEISPTVTNGPPFSRTGNERVECEALVAIPFDTTQITSPGNYSRPKDGDPCHPLCATAHVPAVAVSNPPHAFKIRGGCEGGGKGYLGMDEQVFTITTGHDQQVAVPCYGIIDDETVMDNCLPTMVTPSSSGGGHPPAVATQYAVRRLTPVECERLQGFPDNYTNIPWRGKPESPDGPRYKALGNSWAVPCVTWIGKRINEAVR